MPIEQNITCPCNISGRKALLLVQSVSIELKEQIRIRKGDRMVNMYSLLGVLSLNLKKGDEVTISTSTKTGLQTIINILNTL